MSIPAESTGQGYPPSPMLFLTGRAVYDQDKQQRMEALLMGLFGNASPGSQPRSEKQKLFDSLRTPVDKALGAKPDVGVKPLVDRALVGRNSPTANRRDDVNPRGRR